MKKQFKKLSRKVSTLVALFNGGDIGADEFNIRLRTLNKTALQIGYIQPE